MGPDGAVGVAGAESGVAEVGAIAGIGSAGKTSSCALADVATRTTISAGVAVNARQRLLPITRLPFYRAG